MSLPFGNALSMGTLRQNLGQRAHLASELRRLRIVLFDRQTFVVADDLTSIGERPTLPGMVDHVEDPVLEHLRHIRSTVDRMESRLDDLTSRVGRLETNVAQVQVTLAEHSVRMDRMETRLTRIEKRLDPVEA